VIVTAVRWYDRFRLSLRDVGDLLAERARPSQLYAAEKGARAAAAQLIRDAGDEPVPVGGLEQARALEDHLTWVMLPALQGGLGPFFYRYAKPGEL
jgi:8-hydroxy-5-deazaflavin:NADPH oxidoreductase